MSKLRRHLSGNTSNVVETKNLVDIKSQTGNLYESIAIVSRRANQINISLREELFNEKQKFFPQNYKNSLGFNESLVLYMSPFILTYMGVSFEIEYYYKNKVNVININATKSIFFKL